MSVTHYTVDEIRAICDANDWPDGPILATEKRKVTCQSCREKIAAAEKQLTSPV